jgi:hypothetical protein
LEVIMTGSSTLDPDNFPELPDRVIGRGHGTGALGPSDSSDTGSDVAGGPGMAQEEGLDLGSGTTSDLEQSMAGGTAGPDVGDANLDSDSDSSGTGECAAAGRDTVARDGGDIDTDHIETVNEEVLDEDDLQFLSSRPPGEGPRKSH